MNPAMAAQYRNYQQHAQAAHQRPGQHSTPRRGVGPMIPGPHGQIHQSPQAKQHQHAQMQNQYGQRKDGMSRARVPTDRNMPDGIEDLVVGDGVQEYKRLREVERKMDAAMTRKRLELQEVKLRPGPRDRRLRIWVTNTAENQPWQGKELDENAFDFSSGTEATYKMRIVGKLLDDANPEEQGEPLGEGQESNGGVLMEQEEQEQASKKAEPPPTKKLSDFFHTISVELDRSKALQPDAANLIEWKRPRIRPNIQNPQASDDFDTLQFERKGDENINCTISLHHDEYPEHYALSKELADIVLEEEATKEQAVSALWMYIKTMGLQRDEEKRHIQCDEALRALFKADAIYFPQISEALTPHLHPLPPVKLAYTIRVDPDFQANPTPTVYDIAVAGPDPLHEQLRALTQRNPEHIEALTEINRLDQEIAYEVQALTGAKARHSFFASFARDPATFVRKWVSSQKRDMEIILGDSRVGSGGEWMGDEFRRGGRDGVWGSENVRESVSLLVARPGAWGR